MTIRNEIVSTAAPSVSPEETHERKTLLESPKGPRLVKDFFEFASRRSKAPLGAGLTSGGITQGLPILVSSFPQQPLGAADAPPSLRARLNEPYIASFHAISEWDGYVTDIRDDVFEAELVQLGPDATKLLAEIPLEELSQADRLRLSKGQLFRLTVGFEMSRSGTRKRISSILLRNLPAMHGDEKSLMAIGERRAKQLKWDTDE